MKTRHEDLMFAFYANVDERRRQELVDSRMVQEDKKAMANLSETPVYHTFNQDRFVERFRFYNQNTKR